MINLTVKLSGMEANLYESVGRRVCSVCLVSETEDYDAIITDNSEFAEKAAKNGKHMLLVSTDVNAIKKTAELCQQAGTCFMPAFSWRFLPSVRAMHESLKLGKLGDPGLLRIHRWIPAADRVGSALDRVLNEIDIANWIFEAMPTTIYSVNRDVSGRSYLQVHFGFPGDGMALIDYSWGLPPGGSYNSLSLIGSNGAAYADDQHNMHLLYGGQDPVALKAEQGLAHLRTQLQEFVDSIRMKRTPSITVEDACTAIQVADATLQSAHLTQVATRMGDHYEFA